MNTITLTGSEQQVSDEITRLKKDFSSNYGDLAIETIDDQEADINQIISAVSSLPFLAEKKLIILKDISLNKNIEARLEDVLMSVSDQVQLVLVERKLDRRSKAFKTMKQDTVFKDLNPLKGGALMTYVAEQAKAIGLKMSINEAEHLVNQVGDNEMALKNELLKLLAYGKADTNTIDLLIEKQLQSKIFDLLDYALNKNFIQVEKIYEEQRAQKVEPQSVLGLIIWQLQVLALAKVASNLDDASKKSGISGYPLKRARLIASKLSYDKLVALVDSASSVDVAIKNGANPDDAVRVLLAELST